MKPRNRRKANLGMAWEKTIAVEHLMYLRRGAAHIGKIPTPLKPVEPPHARTPSERARFGGGSAVCMCRTEPTRHVDFEGVVLGGRSVRLEAKSSRAPRIPLDAVKPHQAKALGHCDTLGGFAAVLVLIEAGMFLVPWIQWQAVPTSTGRILKSLSGSDLEVVGLRFGTTEAAQAVLAGASTRADWLTAAKKRGWI